MVGYIFSGREATELKKTVQIINRRKKVHSMANNIKVHVYINENLSLSHGGNAVPYSCLMFN